MIVDSKFLDTWTHKGHTFGQCMSKADSDLMYINIPKNASSWTKPNLLDWGWEFYNYRTDGLNKHAMVVLRDPVDRWLSGIAEYLTLYHPNFGNGEWTEHNFNLVFDRVCFDDHTDIQVKFIDGIDTDNCTFFWFGDNYRQNFHQFLTDHNMPNKYQRYDYQHVSDNEPIRKNFKELFKAHLQVPKYLDQIKSYYRADYELINQVKFYGTK